MHPWTEAKTGYHQKTFQDLGRASDNTKDMIVDFFFLIHKRVGKKKVGKSS